MLLRKNKAQTVVEYAIVIVVVIAAFTVMRHYFTQAKAGKLKEDLNRIGQQFNAEGDYTNAWQTTVEPGSVTTTVEKSGVPAGGGQSSTVTTSEKTTRGEYETWGTNPGLSEPSKPNYQPPQ